MSVNKWTALPSNPSLAVSLMQATGGEPGRSALWALLSRYGVVDVLSVAFHTAGGCGAGLSCAGCRAGPAFPTPKCRPCSP